MSLRTLASLSIIIALAAATDLMLRDARAVAPSAVDTMLDVPPVSSDVLRAMSLGFTSLAADVEFLTAIQVYGDRKFTTGKEDDKQRYSLAVYRLLDYATSFDPQFDYAYIFGANAIPLPTFEGPMQNAPEAIALMKKAMHKVGTRCDKQDKPAQVQIGCDWRIPFYLGYMMTAYEGDFADAAPVMAEAARRPRSPPYLGGLAARLSAQSGELEAGIQLAAQMEDTAETEEKKEEAHERRLSLLMERDIRGMEFGEKSFVSRMGRFPKSLEELVDTGYLHTVPMEAHKTGGTYVLDPATGEITSTVARRLRLPKRTMEEIERAVQPASEKGKAP